MIKKFVVPLLIFLNCSVVWAIETISLNYVDEYIIREDNVIDYVIGTNGIIDIKRSNNEFTITPVSSNGKTYVLFLKSNGNISYIIDVKNNRSEGLNKKRTKLVSGTLKGRMGFSDKTKENPYSLNLSLMTRLSENSNFTFTADHFNNYGNSSKNSETNLTSWTYSYQDYYLSWSQFSEPTASPYYTSNRFRGYTAGKKTNDIDIGFWTANKFYTNKEDPSFKAKGFFLRDNYGDLSYKLILNNKDERYIPQAAFSFNYLDVLSNFSGSFFEEKYAFRYFGIKNFNKGSDDFNLKSITGLYSTSPKGAYGLDNENNNFYENYGGSINFSNQERDLTDVKRDIDFLEGVVTTSFSYDAGVFNDTRKDSFALFAGYGKFDKLTLSGVTNYSLSNVDKLTSEQFLYSPRLSFFFIGDKNNGYSFRNEYTSTITKDYLGDISEKYRNIVGLYKNTRKYYFGLYGGNSNFSFKSKETSSRVLGMDYLYWVKDNLSFRVLGENTTATETGNYENEVGFETRGVYKKDLSLYGKVKYEEKNDIINNQKQSSVVGTIGFVWNFGYGEGNVYDNLDSISKSISGTLYNDINFNGKKDDNEPVLSGISVSVVKTGTNQVLTDSDGSFSFSGFSSKEIVSLTVDSEKYVPGQIVSLNMSKSQDIEIPMYEFDLKKVYVKNSSNETIFSSEIIFSCERNNKLHKEIYSEYTLYYLPKNQKCDPELSTSASGGTIISEVKETGSNSIVITLEVVEKAISFEFNKKIKSFSLNNKLISPNSKFITIPINEYKGFLDIKLQKNCNISPENYKIPYNNLKIQNFYKISCF